MATLVEATKICILLMVISSLVAVNRNLPKTLSVPAKTIPACESVSSGAVTTATVPVVVIVATTVAPELAAEAVLAKEALLPSGS